MGRFVLMKCMLRLSALPGDQEMNAKEFTCGLSDICLGSDDERQGFAYRFYDITGEGNH